MGNWQPSPYPLLPLKNQSCLYFNVPVTALLFLYNLLILHITVDERPFGQNASVSIDQPDIMRLTVGQTARLTCTASGLTNPRISWRRRSGLALPAGHSQRNGVLTIPRIEAGDEGEYICSVVSREVRQPFTASVTIIVTGKFNA